MCGITGIINFDAADAVDRRLVERMTSTIAHRGPDDSGYFLEGHVGLGHRRLSIIDLSGGHQPISSEDGSVTIVFNGEVYNFGELTRELKARGHSFKTHSDTEAMVHAYEEYGDACLERFRGMFAFALWDARRRRLLIARDRLGIKPVYLYHGPGFLAFASEIKALLEIPGIPREVDRTALDHYLSLRYVPGPRTMFRHITKLQPGHMLVVDEHGVRTRPYWDVTYAVDGALTEAAALERFRELLDESVRLRLIAEVPLGVFLSGGLDSSAILGVMSRLRQGEPIKTFSVGYQARNAQEEESNEFSYARIAADHFGAEHHEFRIDAGDFRDFLPHLVWSLDEPLADPTCIPLYFISRLARRHITVVLSGEGADEILGGYGIYHKMLAIESLRRLPLAAQLAPALARIAPGEKLASYLRMAGMPLEARHRGISRAFRPEMKARLLNGHTAAAADSLDALYSACFRAAGGASALGRMLYADTKIWLPDDLLLKADKMTMANALELRVPFLDHKLVEFAATLPDRLKLNGKSGKYLLRRAVEDVMPHEILHRGKKGFPVPTESWLGGQLKQFTREALLARDSACRRHLDGAALEQLVAEHEQGANRHQELWALLVFEFWHRIFVEQKAAGLGGPPSDLAGAA
jgi:asparagine synthase (glutamine-hydrolysing)